MGPELESNLVLRLGSDLTFGLGSDLKADFSGTGCLVFCTHTYYHTRTLCMGSITMAGISTSAALQLSYTELGRITRRLEMVTLATSGGPW